MSNNIVKTLLVIEDNPGDARLLREMLGSDHPEVQYATTMGEAEDHLSERCFDTILLDLGLPDAHGLSAIRRARAAAPDTPLVVLTGRDDEELATVSLQEGAQDYLIKGQIESRGLLRALRYATERKRLESLKDEFVSTVSHELRTPLTSISASLGLLMGKAGEILPSPVLRLVEIAHANSQRLVRLVNDILDIEKLESGQVVFDLRRIEVRLLVEQAVEANRALAEEHRVHLRIDGSSGGIAYVRADTDRLAQVLANLLSNAIKFSPLQNEVVVTIEQEAELVRVSVRDYGSGIAPNFRSRIFERFAQADASNSRRKGGTGLGLSIVKQIVERLGGRAGFLDAPGGGTIFYVELPSWEGKADLAFVELIEAATLAESNASLEALLAGSRAKLTLTPITGVKEIV
jgi:signal transduction histidine kinase